MKVKYLLTIGLAALAMSAFADEGNEPITGVADKMFLDKHVIYNGVNEIRLMVQNPNYSLSAANFVATVGSQDGLVFVKDEEEDEIYNLNTSGFKILKKWTAEKFFQLTLGTSDLTVEEAPIVLGINYCPASAITTSVWPKNEEAVQFATLYLKADGEKLVADQEYEIRIINVDFASPDANGHAIYPEGMSPDEGKGQTATEGYNIIKVKFDVTAIEDVKNEANVASVKYYNLAGAESSEAFEGVNLMVTKYTDGTTKTVKVIK